MRLPFIPSAYQGRSLNQESARLINLYAELSNAPGSTSIAMLLGTPGLRLFSSGIASPVRGVITGPDGLLYAVQSNALVRVAADGTVSAPLGSLGTSTGRVSMAQNGLLADGIGGNQIAICDGAATYIYNVLTDTFTTVAMPFTQIEYIDSYFIGIDGTMSAYASDIYDGITWNPLATAPIQASSDSIQAVLSLYQQLFFIKEFTTEVYYNNGTATSVGFPYSRMAGAVVNYGTPAPWSVALGGSSTLFLAHERTAGGSQFTGVVMLQGYMPVVVSPPAVIWHMSQSTDLTQCFGYCYSDEGHTFYVLTNPVDNWTWVYDLTTQMWHERVSGGTTGRHRGNCYVKAYGMHLVGDYQSGRLYEMSSRFYTDAGQPITSLQRTQHLVDSDKADIFIGELQVDIESGVGMDGPAVPATAVALMDATGGVASVTVTDPGADYISVVDQYTAVQYADGSVVQFEDGATVTTLVPSVTVTLRSVDGNGSGAQAVATLQHGSVTSVTVTDRGSGYTRAPAVTILGQPVAAMAALRISRDSGHTWSNEYPRSMGGPGEYRKRLVWRSLGRARDRVFQLRISSPCKRVILGYVVQPV
jgi:hypothetical protein